MNRIFSDTSTNGRSRPSRLPFVDGQRRDAETVKRMLREIAFVLEMTRRVKSEILEEGEILETAPV